MTDLERVMWEGWVVVGAMLEGNPDELRARLARRRSRMFLRPLRAFCLAVRASDYRINLATAIIVPEHALDVKSEWHPGRVVAHEVDLNARLLRKLCVAVEISPPGEPAYEVAKRLGCAQGGVMALRRNGRLRVHYVKGLLGRRGKATPMVYTEAALDPSAWGKSSPDPIWGCLWRHHAEWLPEDFTDTLMRVSDYRPAQGGAQLREWRWVCPGCKKSVRTVYCPLRVPDWGTYVGLKRGGDEVAERNSFFACGKCHGVVNFSRARLKKSWNQLVLHYSGGLMYGREVKRPEWLKEARKRAYRARPKEARRRDELERWLVRTGLSLGEIAREMGVKYETVGRVACEIYRRHGVHSRAGLREAMAVEVGGPMKSAG